MNLSEKAMEIDWRYISGGLLLLVVLGAAALYQTPGSPGDGVIGVELVVDYPGETLREEIRVSNGSTAFEALNQSFEVGYSQGAQGIFIESIEGVEMNSTHSWIYFVNNETPDVGAGQYMLEEGELLAFRYMSNEEAMEYFE